MTSEEMTDQRALNALHAMQPHKRAEMLAVLEAMAKAFPKPALATPKKPALLALVVNAGDVSVRQRLQHDAQGVLPALRLSTVGAQ